MLLENSFERVLIDTDQKFLAWLHLLYTCVISTWSTE